MTLPIIGITMGDPAGVGPEVIVGAYNAGLSNLECHPIVIGNADRLRDAARIMGHDVRVAIFPLPAADNHRLPFHFNHNASGLERGNPPLESPCSHMVSNRRCPRDAL